MTKASRRKNLKITSHRPTMREIEREMATEIKRIIEKAGNDEAHQIAQLGNYVSRLYEKHPDWQPVMEMAHQKLLGRPMRRLDPTRAVSRSVTRALPNTPTIKTSKNGHRK